MCQIKNTNMSLLIHCIVISCFISLVLTDTDINDKTDYTQKTIEAKRVCEKYGLRKVDPLRYMLMSSSPMTHREGCYMHCFIENMDMGSEDGLVNITKFEEIMRDSPSNGTPEFDRFINIILKNLQHCNDIQPNIEDGCKATTVFCSCMIEQTKKLGIKIG